MRNKLQETMFAGIDFSNFSAFIFKANHVFIENKGNISEKNVIDDEELDGIDIDGIGNLKDLPRILSIDYLQKEEARGFTSQ